MADTDGLGADSGALVCICIDCAPCTGTTKGIGAECGHIGICGVVTIITKGHVGSGPTPTVVWADICIASGCTSVGMVADGTTCGATGSCGDATITTTGITAGPGGFGDAITGWVCTCTVYAPCTATIRVNGDACAHTGTCGVAITTTGDLVGSGDVIDGLEDICTASGFCGAGMVHDGTMSERIGTCTVGTTTITICTDGTGGPGDASGASASTCIACAHFTAIIRAIGVACALTGICGDVTIITAGLAGSGPTATFDVAATVTDCVS